MAGITAESMRVKKNTRGWIKLAKKAMPAMWFVREDHGQVQADKAKYMQQNFAKVNGSATRGGLPPAAWHKMLVDLQGVLGAGKAPALVDIPEVVTSEGWLQVRYCGIAVQTVPVGYVRHRL